LGPFYEGIPESALRFGDVLTGFQLVTPQAHNPSPERQKDWAIAVTPCCSIERKAFALAPLLQVRPSFLENEYLAEDLTRINRKVAPEQSVPREVWERLPFERRQSLIAKGLSYVFIDCFVYEEHALLPKYTLNRKAGPVELGQYMVDFKSICRVECNRVDRDQPAPRGTKILQLSVWTRQAMREKLSYYYGRPAEEDLCYLNP
jgi:hypothetical protein